MTDLMHQTLQLVSIPIGFSSSLQLILCIVAMTSIWARFQSLSGFQVRCNRWCRCDIQTSNQGFNPYRVFKFAATQGFLGFGRETVKKFQSLSGFQVRCNLNNSKSTIQHHIVSIPIGFSSSLQHDEHGCPITPPMSFNPYRVFKFAATKSLL